MYGPHARLPAGTSIFVAMRIHSFRRYVILTRRFSTVYFVIEFKQFNQNVFSLLYKTMLYDYITFLLGYKQYNVVKLFNQLKRERDVIKRLTNLQL